MRVSAKPLSRINIRRYAQYVRHQLDLDNELFFPIVQVIESLANDEEEDFDIEIVADDEMTETYGTTNTTKNIMVIRERVYIGAVKGNPRDRFTLSHEFGHWLLHQPENVSFARGDIPTYCDPEWQANVFAAELLVPYHLIKGMSIEKIIQECGVSYTCAEIQTKYL